MNDGDFHSEIDQARRYERGLLTKAALGILLVAVIALLHELSLHLN